MLKQVLLARKIREKSEALKTLEEKREELRMRREEMTKREQELESAINEVTEETPAEDRAAIEGEAEEHSAKCDELDAEIAKNDEEIVNVSNEIGELQKELDEVNKRAKAAQADTQTRAATAAVKIGGGIPMDKRFAEMTLEERKAFVDVPSVKAVIDEVRSAIKEKRAINNVGLIIPVEMLELIRHEVARASKLLPYLNVRRVSGTTRQTINGAIPEAVWTEMVATLNEVSLGFNQVEVDGYKVGAYVAVPNSILEDNDVNLAGEIISSLGGAIGKASDKAWLFGKGNGMPLGIVTRLAQTSQPASWGAKAPAWTDLHESNILKINIDNQTGAAFFSTLIEKLAVAKDYYHEGGLFWVMNRKTHLHLMAKALAFNSAAALVSNTSMMPIIGGSIIEFEDDEIQDNTVYGGFGGNYLVAERAGIDLASSDIPLFIQDQTVFKATARYDGMPLAGEAFVVLNFANTDATTEQDFAPDYANTEMTDLTLTAAQGGTAGKTVITASGTVAQSDPVLKYKLGNYSFEVGADLPAGWETLESGTTAITAAAGKKITVVELDSAGKVVAQGVVVSVPKT